MSTAPAFASVGEAIEMARAALGYLAAVDAAQLPAETQAECLCGLERFDAVCTAVRASFLSAFTVGQGYSADADYSARAWLMHKTGITRGAAASHTAWATRAGTHPAVVAALAAGELSESYGRSICRWTDRLPEKYRAESDELLLAAAAAGLGLPDLAALFAEMYERARADLPDQDPDRDFADRGVRLETTFQGAGVLYGDLTPECAALVSAVLDALAPPAGAEDDRSREQRYHEGLQEAMRRLAASGLLPERAGQPVGPPADAPPVGLRQLPASQRRHHRGVGPGPRGPGGMAGRGAAGDPGLVHQPGPRAVIRIRRVPLAHGERGQERRPHRRGDRVGLLQPAQALGLGIGGQLSGIRGGEIVQPGAHHLQRLGDAVRRHHSTHLMPPPP